MILLIIHLSQAQLGVLWILAVLTHGSTVSCWSAGVLHS